MSGLFVTILLLGDSGFSIMWSVLHGIPVILVTMTAFIVNDIYDYEKDLLSNFDRPIVKGLLQRKTARRFAAFLALCATIIAVLFKVNESFIIFAAALIGAFLYSPTSRRAPVIKGIFTAALCLAAVKYAGTIAGITIPIYLYTTIAFFIVGRELWLDTKHFDYDSSFDLKTIPSFIGLNNSQVIAWSFMFGSIVTFLLIQTNISALILASGGVVCLGLAILFDVLNIVEHAGFTTLAMLFIILAMPYAI
jgi:4-hydroxybenzoate polyprenyltransferase